MIKAIVVSALMLVSFVAGVALMLLAKMISEDDARVIVYWRNPQVQDD